MTEIRTMTRFTGVDPGDADAFRSVVAEAAQRVANEPGTVGYAWFESSDGTEFVAQESFVDSDAVLAHAANVGDLVGQWVGLADGVDVEIFGAPSDELRSALSAMGPGIYSPVST